MTREDIFKCRSLKRTFTVGRCLRNQKDALVFWGPDASKYQSCPCDQGIEIRQQMEGTMGARAICRNCEREMALMQDGMCGGCFNRGKGLSGEEREKALAQAKADFQGKGPRGGGRAPRVKSAAPPPRKAKVEGTAKKDPASGAIAPGSPLGLSPKVEGAAKKDTVSDFVDKCLIPSDPRTIILHFNNGDEALLEKLSATAKRFRREPAAQILWMLQHGLDYLDNLEARGVVSE